MFKFSFNNKKTIARDESSYPISLEEVKAKSFYFKDIPADDTQDDYIETFLIPEVVRSWEDQTKYILLDTTIKAFVNDIKIINTKNLEINLTSINVRESSNIKYYPYDWDESSAKTDADSLFIKTEEIDTSPISLRLTANQAVLSLYPITNNLEITYLAGFEDNDFSNIPSDVKNALIMQAAMIIDIKNGYCEDYYSDAINRIYERYSINKQYITVL